MGGKEAYKLKAHGEDVENAVLSRQVNLKLRDKRRGRIKLLPRFHIKVLEYLEHPDAMDDVEQTTMFWDLLKQRNF